MNEKLKMMKKDWVERTLGEIAKIYNGNSINKQLKEEKYKYCKTGLNYIGTKDVEVNGKINYDTGVIIPNNESKFKIAPKGCVLVCSEGGSAGKKTAFVETDICFGNKLYAITNSSNNHFEGKYVYYYTRFYKFFNLFRNQMNGIIGGVSQRKFLIITIPLPPLVEQKAIVKKIEQLFSSLDSGIADLKKAQEQLKIYRQAVLKKAFEGGDKIEISKLVNNLNQGWSPKCINKNSTDITQWAVIKTSAIQSGKFVEFENKILPESLEPREQHEIKKGDILITRAGPRVRVGICCLVKITRPKLINCDKVYRLELNQELVKAEYFEYVLNSPEALRDIEKMKSGSSDSGLNLTQKVFLKLLIPYFEIEKQTEIVRQIESRLSVCDKVEQDITLAIERSRNLRQSILKKAFEGRLLSEAEISECKQDAAYEPASVLLEKIKAETLRQAQGKKLEKTQNIASQKKKSTKKSKK